MRVHIDYSIWTRISNNIYINSKAAYAYGISMPAYNHIRLTYNKVMSSGFRISGNTIIMIGTGVTEAIYADVLTESEIMGNNINIIWNWICSIVPISITT